MPGCCAHLHFGRQMGNQLPSDMKEVLQKKKALFEIGLNGPDILFYYKAPLFNPVSKTGCQIHRRPAKGFLSSVEMTLPSLKDPAALAYLLGFTGHFAIDRACHTYIKQETQRGAFSHTEMETALDMEIMRRSGIDLSRHPPVSHIYSALPYSAVIASFYPRVNEKQIASALRSMIFYLKLFSAPQKGKEMGLRIGMKAGLCYRKLGGLIVTQTPDDRYKSHTDMLLSLCEKAVKDGKELMENLWDHLFNQAPLDPRFSDTFGAKPQDIETIALSPRTFSSPSISFSP